MNFDKFIDQMKSKDVAAVGWFPGSRYEDGTPVAQVAATQEFGSPRKGIPPRLGMRQTIKAKRRQWGVLAKILSRRVLRGEITKPQLLEQLSLVAEGDFKITIKNVTSPPLKDSTVRSRLAQRKKKGVTGSLTKPLIFSNTLLNTLGRVIKKK
jgi:hypothetical protein